MSGERPLDQETNPKWNARKGGIVTIPGSWAFEERAKFEKPWVYQPYPKMLYRAEKFNGKNACMAAPPDSYEFKEAREFARVEESARRFTERCQRIVQNEEEHQKAAEDGWRESPAEAVAYLEARDKDRSTATAHRNYEDRNMSDAAKREIAEQIEAAGGAHQPEITEKKRRPGRPKGSKNKRKE